MTNEEAISVIENEIQIDVRLCTDEQVDKFQTALYMAISSLRAEPTGKALTLEQLQEMDGKPVWCKCLHKEKYLDPPIGWRIVERSISGTVGVRNGESCFPEREYGVDWLAYAYPPAHINREAWEPCPLCGEYKVFQFKAWGTIDSCLGNPDCMGTSLFCPHCGRPLTEKAWAELEKRMGVMV